MHCPRTSRRSFLQSASLATAACALPAVWTSNKSGSRKIVGNDEFAFEISHDWAKLPPEFSWQTTHNVCMDKQGFIYVIHEGHRDKPNHPSIFVFDPDGRLVRSFGEQFQGGGHGIEVRQEGNEEFLYVAAYQHLKTFAKLDLLGEMVWQQYAPMKSGAYAENEDTNPQRQWGRDRFMPTNFAFLPDGGFYLADGYGSYLIHRYDTDGNWVNSWGGPGDGKGTFNTPHGLWIDQRSDQAQLIVTDRAHHTLQVFDIEGQFQRTVTGFGLPANVDTWNDLLVVPELWGRVSLLDKALNQLVVLGDDRKRVREDKQHEIRRQPNRWQEGKFVHPHDACFDHDGNIFVAEWVATGRISKLTRL